MQLSRISDLFWKTSPNLFFFSVVLGAFTGLGYAVIIPLVMYSVSEDRLQTGQLEVVNYSFFNSPTEHLAQLFLLACLLIIVIKASSMILTTYLVRTAAVAHRLSIYRRIQRLSLLDLEKIGQSKLINLLNIDVPTVTNAAIALPTIWVNIITLLGTFAYLLYLDQHILFFVLGCLVVGIITFQLPVIFATGLFAKSRDHFDRIQEGVRGLIFGAKELKLNDDKAQEYYENALKSAEQDALSASLKGNSVMIVTESYGEVISLLIIGIAIFHLSYIYNISTMNLFGIVMALLYLMGPVGAILNSIATVRNGKVSLDKLMRFYDELEDEQAGNSQQISPDWQQLKLKDLHFHYPDNENSFAVENINAVFERGQVSFIVGGNGSGKSTLAKCLTLHYQCQKGGIFFDQQPVNNDSLISARKNIGAIYSDYYLFSRLYGLGQTVGNEQINEVLSYLELDKKVTFSNGQFSTTNLSDGQRKRLALVVLLLEDQPICVFDEWAADQDPRFKALFYTKILARLKAQNKVVIVISHDDRYFDYADQLIVMDTGQIRETKYLTEAPGKTIEVGTNDEAGCAVV